MRPYYNSIGVPEPGVIYGLALDRHLPARMTSFLNLTFR